MGIKRESLPNPHPERRVDAVFPPDEAAGDRCEQGGGPGDHSGAVWQGSTPVGARCPGHCQASAIRESCSQASDLQHCPCDDLF